MLNAEAIYASRYSCGEMWCVPLRFEANPCIISHHFIVFHYNFNVLAYHAVVYTQWYSSELVQADDRHLNYLNYLYVYVYYINLFIFIL